MRSGALLFAIATIAACSGDFSPPSSGANRSAGSVCPGPDELEPNDDADRPFALELDRDQRLTFAAGTDSGDRDFYLFTAPLADPVSVDVVHRPPAEPLIEAALLAADREPIEAHGAAQLRLSYRPSEAQMQVTLRIRTDAGDCTPYEVVIDALACSDDFEDNDTLETARPIEREIEAKVAPLDPDHYIVPAPAGACVIEARFPQDPVLVLAALGEDGEPIETHVALEKDGVRSATVSWTAGDRARALRVSAESCLDYRLRCD